MGKTPKSSAPPPEPPEPEGCSPWSPAMNSLLAEIAQRFPEVRHRAVRLWGEPALLVSPEEVLDLAGFLKNNEICAFNFCRSVTGTDKIERFEVVYNLARLPAPGDSPSLGFETIGIIVYVTNRAEPRMPSLVGIWPGVDFQEREVYDMLGVVFDGHPDLRRILLDESFKGHPLRKDYPLMGKWEDMIALDAHLDENQVRTMKEQAGLKFDPDDVPPSFKQ